MFDGFLNIKKPSGITSFDAVKMVLGEILDGKKFDKKIKCIKICYPAKEKRLCVKPFFVLQL